MPILYQLPDDSSAGIGRTGTYIALDVLLDEMETTGRVDILKFVTNMRYQRKGLVQTKVKYPKSIANELDNNKKIAVVQYQLPQQLASIDEINLNQRTTKLVIL